MVRGGKLSIIGNGVVLDPWHLLSEIETLTGQGVTIDADTLKIAENTPLILPVHGELDRQGRPKGHCKNWHDWTRYRPCLRGQSRTKSGKGFGPCR